MSNFNVLALTRYGRLGASSRVRFFQFQRLLESVDVDVRMEALISDDMLRERYRLGKYNLAAQIGAYIRRIGVLLERSSYDVIWIEKEALPWWPVWLERWLLRGVPYVLDYDDAVFHNYDLNRRPWVRYLFGDRLDKLMAGSMAVVAGNNYLAERAAEAGAKSISVVPTVVDTALYTPSRPDNGADVRSRIVWIGSPSTQKYLENVSKPLEMLARRHEFVLRVIGAEAPVMSGVETELVEWREETEVERIQECSVGIMPLTDSPWERGKCGYKLIQYMACGLPVVASPVGVNVEIVHHGSSGFLAESDMDWVVALESLLEDAGKRRRMGEVGRRTVEDRYSIDAQGPRLLHVLREAAAQ